MENHLSLAFPLDVRNLDPTGQVDTVDVVVFGNTDLDPERLLFGEVAPAGRYGRVRTRTALFAYQLRDVYMATEPLLSEPREGVVRFQVGSVNGGTTSAWGGEALVEARLTPHLTTTLSYSHQDLSGTLDDQVTEKGTPHDKSSGKVRYRRAGWVADVVLHRAGTVSPEYEPSHRSHSGVQERRSLHPARREPAVPVPAAAARP